ncbi:MAG: TonB-dependent receptor [Bacteroidales bacterium]|nr:TonB-dependent receptor [Bacteroidales bacterium]
MSKKRILLAAMLLCNLLSVAYGQRPGPKRSTDANIIGHVVSGDEHLPFASVVVVGTTIGTSTDETGHYRLFDLPEGELVVEARTLGYRAQRKTVVMRAGQTVELNFELEPDALNVDEVVVSANRTEQKRTEAPTIVNTISPKLFATAQSITLGEGLNFSPGLRLENNCQNCGFSQVRLNGMEGPYTQILINSRPIFSGLAGVYGLELIPANMIERVEVIRGGSSALFGSNAIAGTVNIILREPQSSSYEVGGTYSAMGLGMPGGGGPASDYQLNFNTSIVSADSRTGMTLYGFSRSRSKLDITGDSFSEIPPIINLTLGTRFFHRVGERGRLSVDFFNIREERDGGNRQDYPEHERDIAEVLKHDMKSSAITFEQMLRHSDMLSVYASGQLLRRNSYYGANRALDAYGRSHDNTYNIGAQYKWGLSRGTLVAGAETTGDFLTDIKLGYPEYDKAVIEADTIASVPHTENTTISDQRSSTMGLFVQYDVAISRLKLSVGGRFDRYNIIDKRNSVNDRAGNVFSPRVGVMYGIIPELQARFSYSQGYRAPQLFDEDLHVEISGARHVVHQNAANLRQETSHSAMLSFDYNGMVGNMMLGLLLEGFYTRLKDPFVNEIGKPDANGTVVYTRVNSPEGATVQGLNMELKLRPLRLLQFTSGFTLQRSRYDAPQDFDERNFFRTPNAYGFFAADYDVLRALCLSATGTYTGPMLVPYFGPTAPEGGELRRSGSFFDLGLKLKYTVRLNSANLQLFAGVKNVLNSFQRDHDAGINRDPAYVYGPSSPRTLYFGIKLGNNLN